MSRPSISEAKLRMLELGVNDYITKPFIPETVQRRVRNVMEYNERFRRLVAEYKMKKSV